MGALLWGSLLEIAVVFAHMFAIAKHVLGCGLRPVRILALPINRCLGKEQSSQDDSNFPNGGGDRLSKSVAGGGNIPQTADDPM